MTTLPLFLTKKQINKKECLQKQQKCWISEKSILFQLQTKYQLKITI